MSGRDVFETCPVIDAQAAPSEASLPGQTSALPMAGIVLGELLALLDNGATALVLYPGQPGHAALRARAAVDLHGQHIGRAVVLAFEAGDAMRPIVMGVLRGDAQVPLDPVPGHLEVDVDGQRMVLTARDQLVLCCGKARITLTRAGKVLIEGTFISSRSSGVNRIKGGSVQLN